MGQVVKIEHNDKEMTLQVDKEHLKDFVSGLLGEPQSIEKIFTIPFRADHNYFINLINLIKQKLERQNDYAIVSFQATVKFQDNLKRKINSIEAFEAFVEDSNAISTGLVLKIGMLVQFPKKEIPEKQEIDIYFMAPVDRKEDGPKDIFDLAFGYKPISGIVNVEIKHTERTWADDMLTVIEKSFNDIWMKEPRYKAFLRPLFKAQVMLNFSLLTSILILIVMIMNKMSSENSQYSEYLGVLDGRPLDLENLHLKVDFIANNVMHTPEYSYIPDFSFYGFSLIMFIFIMFFVFMKILKEFFNPSKSFVILSKKTERHIEEISRNTKNKLWVLSILGTLLLGLTINYVYDLLQLIKI